MYKFFSSMWDERAEIDTEYLLVHEYISEKLDKREVWEEALEQSQAKHEAEIFTQDSTVQLSINYESPLDGTIEDNYTESTARTTDLSTSSCLTKHSKIALLKMFMLKKQLNLLRQQQDSFGRNWLLPFNEKNQYDVTQTMKACKLMQ